MNDDPNPNRKPTAKATTLLLPQPPRPLQCVPYFDVVVAWFKRPLSASQLKKVQQLCRDHNHDEALPIATYPWRHSVTLQKPTPAAFAYLARLPTDHPYLIVAVEVTIDYIMQDNAAAFALRDFLRRHLVQGHHKTFSRNQYKNTTYWTPELTGNPPKKVRRQFVLYADKRYRLVEWDHSLVGWDDCVHLEMRLVTADAIRKAGNKHSKGGRIGLDTWDKLRTFDHREFWEEHLNLRHLDYETLGRRYHHEASKPTWTPIPRLPQIPNDPVVAGAILAEHANSLRDKYDDLPEGCAQELWDAYKGPLGRRIFKSIPLERLLPS